MVQSPLDLHVLGTPPAFVLSQDQTLMFNPLSFSVQSSINSSLLTVVLRFLFLYRFQGSVALSSAVLSSELGYNITPIGFCQHLFLHFWNFFVFFLKHELFLYTSYSARCFPEHLSVSSYIIHGEIFLDLLLVFQYGCANLSSSIVLFLKNRSGVWRNSSNSWLCFRFPSIK